MNTPQEGNYEYAKILGLISPSLPSSIPGNKTYTYFDRFLWLAYILLFSSLCQQRPCAEREDGSVWFRDKDTSWFLLLSHNISFKHQTIPFFPPFSVVRLINLASPPPKKGTGRSLTFLTLIGSFNLNNEHRNSFSRHRSFSGVSFLLLYYIIDHHISHHIEFVSICWPCLVVSRVHSIDAVVSDLLFSGGFVLYYALTLNEKKGRGMELLWHTNIVVSVPGRTRVHDINNWNK